MTDPRFDTSKWAAEDGDVAAAAIAGPSSSSSPTPSGSRSPSRSASEASDDEGNDDPNEGPTVTPLTPHELEAFQRKQKKRGIVYISRIPPGMTPPKVRHLLSGYGEVERIYLQDGRKKEREAEAGRKLGE